MTPTGRRSNDAVRVMRKLLNDAAAPKPTVK